MPIRSPICLPVALLVPVWLLGVGQSAVAADAAVVPSSITIAFDSTAVGPVDVVSADGTNEHQVGPAGAYSPTWKPDGSALAMTTFNGANLTGVAIVSADGSSARQLPALGHNPVFSPDGTQLVYWTGQAPNKELVTVANADGTDAHVVWDDTKGILSADLGFLPHWAPDGSAVAFNTFPAGCTSCLETGSPTQVWIVNADGTGLHQVPNADGIEHVAWSSDGLWLVGDGQIRVHPDGTGRSEVSGPGGVASPDGSKVAYATGTESAYTLSIANADGSSARVVVSSTDPADNLLYQVQWLPDGSGIVFTHRTYVLATNSYTSVIAIVNSDGSGFRTLATGQDPVVPSYITRLAGTTRVDTSTSVSRATFASASAVVVARDDLYPDALAAGPLASKLKGPLLLSPPAAITSGVATEVKRLGAKTAYLIGDATALSANVETGLRAAGVTTFVRIGGATRYDTAAMIAEKIGGTSVYIARGDAFPDAASVAGLAAFQQRPIVLVPPGTLSSGTTATLSHLDAVAATIIGGTSAVSVGVQSGITALGLSVTRVSGSTRYGTSAAVANLAATVGMTGAPWLADGSNWPDALSAGPAAATVKADLLLVDPNTLGGSPDTRAWLAAHRPTAVVAVGGPDVVSAADAFQTLNGS